MRTLTEEVVLALHHLMTEAVGGGEGLRDRGLLEGALAAAEQTFDGVELYPTLAEKVARITHSLIANHAFLDGNKRIGILVMLVLLEANGAPIRPTDDALTELGLGVASGALSYRDILAFIRKHTS